MVVHAEGIRMIIEARIHTHGRESPFREDLSPEAEE
jgi:hypothetical protein